jgi:hypothetical protein
MGFPFFMNVFLTILDQHDSADFISTFCAKLKRTPSVNLYFINQILIWQEVFGGLRTLLPWGNAFNAKTEEKTT